jgi:hypothetical protein
VTKPADLTVTLRVGGTTDQPVHGVVSGVDRIAVERARQKLVEGWSAAHDRGRTDELALAASCYAVPTGRGVRRTLRWPWSRVWWKPVAGSSRAAAARIRELEKAGALIAAAIDDILARGER